MRPNDNALFVAIVGIASLTLGLLLVAAIAYNCKMDSSGFIEVICAGLIVPNIFFWSIIIAFKKIGKGSQSKP